MRSRCAPSSPSSRRRTGNESGLSRTRPRSSRSPTSPSRRSTSWSASPTSSTTYRSGARCSSGEPEKPTTRESRWGGSLGSASWRTSARTTSAAAIAAWKRAAALANAAGDDAIARDLYERVREVAPRDGHAAQCLAELLERAETWDRLPELYAVIVETATNPADVIGTLSRVARVQADRLGDVAAACARGRARVPARLRRTASSWPPTSDTRSWRTRRPGSPTSSRRR